MFNDIKELSASLVAFVSTRDTETTVVNFSSAAQTRAQDQTAPVVAIVITLGRLQLESLKKPPVSPKIISQK